MLHKNIEYYANIEGTVEGAREEIEQGLALLEKISQPIVTFFGSHRVKIGSLEYEDCKKLAISLGENGYAIMSGGGPGIMHASNSGATEAKATSIGLKAKLLTKENITDPIFTENLSFHFLFVRRFIMSIKSEALIFYPGGYGTLNELFEYLVLMQTGIVDTVPIICIDKGFWDTMLHFQGEFAQMFGPKRRGRALSHMNLDPEEDDEEYHRYHLELVNTLYGRKRERAERKGKGSSFGD